MFHHVSPYPGDPILTLNERFTEDPRPGKVNLGIGVLLDEQCRLARFDTVAAAEDAIRSRDHMHPYLPMEGAPAFRAHARALLFGEAHTFLGTDRVATVQTLGGSGALRVGADFLRRWRPEASVWVSDPTWDNHVGLFEGAGFRVGTYPYFCARTKGVLFDQLVAALEALPPGDIVVLHACCHNPTGADLGKEQWERLAVVFRARGLLPFFDIAYQGFGQGLEDDAFPIRLFARHGIPLLAAASFSKNLALYGERCGALHALAGSTVEADNVLGQLKAAVRRNYSSPPGYGSSVATAMLADSQLRSRWSDELAAVRSRIRLLRLKLYTRLRAHVPDSDFDYLLKQQGMFSFTGLGPAQVRRLREEHAIYLVESGRLCIAALSSDRVDDVAAAIGHVMKEDELEQT